MLIFSTYMGDDVTPVADRARHFMWCWRTNIKNFKDEGIEFKDDQEAQEYFMKITFDFFYMVNKEENLDDMMTTVRVICLTVFNFERDKSKREEENFNKIYYMLLESLENKN